MAPRSACLYKRLLELSLLILRKQLRNADPSHRRGRQETRGEKESKEPSHAVARALQESFDQDSRDRAGVHETFDRAVRGAVGVDRVETEKHERADLLPSTEEGDPSSVEQLHREREEGGDGREARKDLKRKVAERDARRVTAARAERAQRKAAEDGNERQNEERTDRKISLGGEARHDQPRRRRQVGGGESGQIVLREHRRVTGAQGGERHENQLHHGDEGPYEKDGGRWRDESGKESRELVVRRRTDASRQDGRERRRHLVDVRHRRHHHRGRRYQTKVGQTGERRNMIHDSNSAVDDDIVRDLQNGLGLVGNGVPQLGSTAEGEESRRVIFLGLILDTGVGLDSGRMWGRERGYRHTQSCQ